MPEQKPPQEINVTVNGSATITGAAIGNDNQAQANVTAGGHVVQAKDSTVTIQQAGGDIVAGNKTVIQNIIRQAAKQIITAPYKFLASYDISDRDIFFGRDAVIDKMVGNFARYKTLVINGRSGAGKTSLINAGLIPRLAENGYHYLSFRDYTDPLRQLREYVAHDPVFQAYADDTASLTRFLKTITRQQQHLVMIFDQFERFFVHVPAALRLQFIQEIKACLNSDLSAEDVDLVFAVREDFFGAFVIEFETQMPTFFNQTDRFNLLPLTRDAAREAILRPLKNIALHLGYHLPFVDEVLLPGLMGESAGGAQIDPPHLQIVCNQLYQAARERYAAELEQGGVAQIDRRLYEELGETSGILRTYLDDFIDRTAQRDSGGRDVLRSMLKLMLETTGTRKFVSFADLKTGLPDVPPAAVEQHIREFQDGRIIETRGQGEAARYSLSHEVMAAKVQTWFDERELERRKAQETLERGLAEWKSSQAILNARQVAHVRTWLGGETLSADAEQLLSTSQQAYEAQQRKEAEQERRITRNRKAFQMALGIGFVIALILSALAFWQRNEAVNQTVIAEANAIEAKKQQVEAEKRRQEADRRAMVSLAQALGFQAIDQLAQHNGPRAALLARQAYLLHQQYHGTMLDQMDNALRRALEASYFHSLVFQSNAVTAVAFSADGKFLATSSEDNIVRVWDLMQPTTAPRVLKGHEDVVRSVAFSPDGHILASGSWDKTIRLWDVTQPTVSPRVLTGHNDRVTSVAFSPDGYVLASGSFDKTVRLWDLTQPTAAPRVLTGHDDVVSSVAFSPDGHFLASGSWDKAVRLWDVSTGLNTSLTQPTAEHHVLTGHNAEVFSVAFSPDGHVLASGSEDKTVRLWDLTQPTAAPRILIGHESWVSSLVFSLDGHVLASGSGDKTVRLWDLTQLTAAPRVLTGHDNFVTSVAFSPNGSFLASGSADNIVRLWDLTQPTAASLILTGHESRVPSLAFSPDGHILASGSGDKTVRLWDVSTGLNTSLTQPTAAPCILTGHDDAVWSVAFSPDGRFLASGSSDKTIRLWDVTQPTTAIRVLTGHNAEVLSVAFSPDGRFLASGSYDKTIRLWDLTPLPHSLPGGEMAAAPRVLSGHNAAVWSVAFSPNGRFLASGSEDETVRLWDLTQPTAVPRVFTGHNYIVLSVAFSPDGHFLASGSMDMTVRVWDLTQPTAAPRVLTGHDNPVLSVAFSPDSHVIASGSMDKTVRLWDLTQPTAAPRVLTGHDNPVRSIAFSPDGRFLASGSEYKTVRIWNVQTEELAALICKEAGRNLTWDEWQQFVGPDIPYERTCPNLPVDDSVVAAFIKDDKFKEAQALVQPEQPTNNISVAPWHALCRYGSLYGHAAEVLTACDQAVTFASGYEEFRDSRGLARALTGNIAGAIEDFQAFVDWTDDEDAKTQRQQWIAALQKGENPLTPEVLEGLR